MLARSTRTPDDGATARRTPRTRLRWVAGLLGAVLAVATGAPARAADAEEPLTASQLAARTYPGVQLVQVDFSATLSVPDGRPDQKAVDALTARLVLQAATGAIGTSQAEIVEAFVSEVAKDPFRYLKPAKTRRSVEASLSGFGTGFVINPEGYMVTAAHVVQPDAAELRTAFARSGLDTFTREDIASLEGDGISYTPEQVERLTEATQRWYARYLKVGKVSSTVSAQIGVTDIGTDKETSGRPVEVVSVGEPYPGKDVAVLKLDGVAHIPTLGLGDDADVSEGDTLRVAGYPAASTFSSGLSEDSQVQPTITEGPLTAIKKTEGGSPVFQTQAPASPGNSGGPVLDDRGRVVGILVASAVDENGVALEGQEFVIPVSVVREKLREQNVEASSSDTTQAYDKALAAYFSRYYSRAMPDFQRVKALYPEHPYVNEFIAQTQTAIDQGKDETPVATWVWLAVAGGVLLLLLLLAGLVLLLVRRRRKRARAAVAGPWPPAGPPAWTPGPAAGPWQQQPQPPQPPAAAVATAPGPEPRDPLAAAWGATGPAPPSTTDPGAPPHPGPGLPPPPPSWATRQPAAGEEPPG